VPLQSKIFIAAVVRDEGILAGQRRGIDQAPVRMLHYRVCDEVVPSRTILDEPPADERAALMLPRVGLGILMAEIWPGIWILETRNTSGC